MFWLVCLHVGRFLTTPLCWPENGGAVMLLQVNIGTLECFYSEVRSHLTTLESLQALSAGLGWAHCWHTAADIVPAAAA
jgi:hypothetical protein